MNAYFTRLYDHVEWGNRRVLELLRQSESVNARALELFSHILNAEQAWITRLEGKDSTALPIWSMLTLEDRARLIEENSARFRQFIEALPEDDFNRLLTYRNQSGKEFQTAISDILTHVAMHSAYHRGQITEAVKHAGGTPVNTDFITFVREIG